ncbi:MAG: J domain-containing protein [Planctomycetia bacterium]|nr:J domain-containing protein [Planctomycetia bacterium]
MAKNYYKTLGVSKTATKEEIGKAYRELARKYHPDLHPDDKTATKKFQEVQEAFECLNDDQKRKMYDQFGPNYENMGAGGPGAGGFHGGARPTWGGGTGQGGTAWQEVDLGDIFGAGGGPGGGPGFDPSSLFGNLGAQFRSAGRRRRAPVKGNDITYPITISFNESIIGSEREVKIQEASGVVKTVTAKIPAGIEDGKKLRLRGLGENSTTGGPSGDLVLEIHVTPHPSFTRTGNNLLLKLPVTIAEATLGAKIAIPTPKGEGTLNIPAGTSSGKKLRVKGAGVPSKTGTGDLLVEIMVNVPTKVSDADTEILRKLNATYPGNLRAGISW